jgi:predicted metal-dependent enzyme (double-stranded beta helix superfamily)
MTADQAVDPAAHTPRTRAFIDDITAIVAAHGHDEQEVTTRVATRAREYLASPVELPPGLDRPDPDHYVMYPLWVDPESRFSIAAAVWNVGQGTPIHDHATWGVVGIVSGVERELRYVLDAGVPVRTGDHAFGPGEVTVCCTTDQDLHQVFCASDTPTVGLHIYGGDIGTIRRRSYAPDTGEITYFVSEWVRPRP